MDNLTLGFSSALFMGLAFGAGPCNITCLPYLGPVFLGQQNHISRTSWQTIIPFSAGRLTGYTLLGTIAGSFGLGATKWIENGFAAQLLGSATLLAGIYLLLGGFSRTRKCSASHSGHHSATVNFTRTAQQPKKSSSLYMSISLFSMGTGMALNPCIPLLSVLTVAASMSSPTAGAKLGVAFGLGAVIIPGLFFGLAIAHFSRQVKEHLRQWQKHLERLSGIMLILLGGFTFSGWVQP